MASIRQRRRCGKRRWPEISTYVRMDAKNIGAFVLKTDPKENDQAGRWKRALSDGEYMVLHALAIDPDRQGRGTASGSLMLLL